MAKEGKKPIGKIVLGIIVVLVIVGAVIDYIGLRQPCRSLLPDRTHIRTNA